MNQVTLGNKPKKQLGTKKVIFNIKNGKAPQECGENYSGVWNGKDHIHIIKNPDIMDITN